MEPTFFIEIDEVALNKMNSSSQEILSFMSSYKYIPYLINNSSIYETGLTEILEILSNNNGYLDVLFLKDKNDFQS
jgi:hypothetical protein